jgi:hypothetical protein
MLSQVFTDRVEELLHNTSTRISEMQHNTCPMINKRVYFNYQFEYWYDGYKYNIWEDNVHLYAVNEIPYCYDNETHNTVFQGKLNDLVDQDKVWPFLLFINGTVIKWSDITIIHDYDYSYIRIDNIVPDYSLYANLLYFPLASKKIRYGEDNNVLLDPNTKGFYFNKQGKWVKNPEFIDLSARLEILDPDIHMETLDITSLTPTGENVAFFNKLGKQYRITKDNLIGFSSADGALLDVFHYMEKLKWTLDGAYNSVSVDWDKFQGKNPRFDCTLVMLYNTAISESMSYTTTKGLDVDKIKKKMKDLAKLNQTEYENKYTDTYKQLFTQFDYEFSYKSSYEDNVINAARYITKYDFSLWNKVFVDKSPIKSFTYTGRQFKLLANSTYNVQLSRKHTDLIEDMAMLFVNGKLYQNSMDISYKNNTINIPIIDIDDSDHVELVLFSRCNNNILDIYVQDENTPVYIHPEYNLDDCYIMSEDLPTDHAYDVPESLEGRRQYICEIKTFSKDANNNYLIKFIDNANYQKKLKIVPKYQFRYYRFKQKSGQFKITLPTQFNYCHDRDRYIVFVNGKKIDKTEYTVTIMNKYRPFDKLILYLTTILDTNDYVDIFYIPEVVTERYKEFTQSKHGIIKLTEPKNYPKTYAFSKDTTMVFLNGLKVNPMDITDVSMSEMMIDSNIREIYNVCIMEFVNGSKEISRFLFGQHGISTLMAKSGTDFLGINAVVGDTSYDIGLEYENYKANASDMWKIIVSKFQKKYIDNEANLGIDDEEAKDRGIMEIFKEQTILEDKNNLITPSYKENYARLRSILYDIVVDYYMQRQEATTGVPFVYDFEVQEWLRHPDSDILPDGYKYFIDTESKYYTDDQNRLYVEIYDEDNNELIKTITLFPDHDKLLDYIPNDRIANANMVRVGKSFISL